MGKVEDCKKSNDVEEKQPTKKPKKKKVKKETLPDGLNRGIFKAVSVPSSEAVKTVDDLTTPQKIMFQKHLTRIHGHKQKNVAPIQRPSNLGSAAAELKEMLAKQKAIKKLKKGNKS